MAVALKPQDREAFGQARLAGFKAALTLTPAQERHWPTLETTIREIAKARVNRWAEIRQTRSQQRESGQPPDITARLRDRAKGLRARADQAEKFADAAAPLFASLDEAQKSRFRLILLRSSERRSRLRAGWQQMARLSSYINKQIKAAS
jgi:hypothetical protein